MGALARAAAVVMELWSPVQASAAQRAAMAHANFGADALAEREAEEEVSEPTTTYPRPCAGCGRPLGECAAVNDFIPGMYCSNACLESEIWNYRHLTQTSAAPPAVDPSRPNAVAEDSAEGLTQSPESPSAPSREELEALATSVIYAHDAWDYAGGLECRCNAEFYTREPRKVWAEHVAEIVIDGVLARQSGAGGGAL